MPRFGSRCPAMRTPFFRHGVAREAASATLVTPMFRRRLGHVLWYLWIFGDNVGRLVQPRSGRS
jgi:hypothetical protein